MLNNVLSRCILWIMGCLLLKETFRNIQKRMDGKWASFFRILAAAIDPTVCEDAEWPLKLSE